MSTGKQKLRPWLEEMITKGEINGLIWLNEEKTKFRIPWKHGGKQDWSPENSRIFMEWAKHTGKYREGVDEPNYPTWKTRLRCAFNKAPDIQEIKDESQLRIHEPFRVYVLTNARRGRLSAGKLNDTKGTKHGNRVGESKRKVGGYTEAGENEISSTQANEDIPAMGEMSPMVTSGALLPTMIAEFDETENSSTPEDCLSSSDLDNLFTNELLGQDNRCLLEDVTDDCLFDGTLEEQLTGEPTFLSFLQMPTQSPIFQPRESSSTLASTKLEVFYFGQRVIECDHDMRPGLRIALSNYDSNGVTSTQFSISDTQNNQLLPCDLRTINLPLCKGTMKLNSPMHEKVVNHLLTNTMLEGLVLRMDDSYDIFASRFCRCAIYYNSQSETQGFPIKMPTNGDQTKIFTYKTWLDRLQDDGYAKDQIDEDVDPAIYLCCGQEQNLHDIPQKVFVYIKITPPGCPRHQRLTSPEYNGAEEEQEEEEEAEEEEEEEEDTRKLFDISSSMTENYISIPCEMELGTDEDEPDLYKVKVQRLTLLERMNIGDHDHEILRY